MARRGRTATLQVAKLMRANRRQREEEKRIRDLHEAVAEYAGGGPNHAAQAHAIELRHLATDLGFLARRGNLADPLDVRQCLARAREALDRTEAALRRSGTVPTGSVFKPGDRVGIAYAEHLPGTVVTVERDPVFNGYRIDVRWDSSGRVLSHRESVLKRVVG